jgi:hypothetical protein
VHKLLCNKSGRLATWRVLRTRVIHSRHDGPKAITFSMSVGPNRTMTESVSP